MKLPSNLRGCKEFEHDNLSMSTASNEAVKLFDASLHQLIGWYEAEELDGLKGTWEKMMNADENFVMGKILINGIRLIGTGDTVWKDKNFADDVQELCKELNSATLNDREKLHIRAIKLFSGGFWTDASDIWEQILIYYPKDVLAVKFAHDTYFYLGQSTRVRDSILRVLPHFDPTHPFYGYLKGMASFGLEETNLYRQAEKAANEALVINQNDAWATHTLAHIFEMEGRIDEGIMYMNKFEKDWKPCGSLACHLYWHWTLYLLEKGDYTGVLKLYDDQIGRRCKSGAMLDLVDSTSLLYRLRFEGVDVENRWDDVVELCRPHVDDQISFFNDIHFAMAFFGGNRRDLVDAQFSRIKNVLDASSDETTYRENKKTTMCMYSAMLAYEENDFHTAVELLFPEKHRFISIGGSHAQRDVFNQLLLQSCIKSNSKKHHHLARNLLYERKALKPNSPLTDRLMTVMLSKHS